MVDARQALLLLLPLPLLLTWPSPLRTMASPVITSYSASIAPLPRGLLLLPEACRITCQGGGGGAPSCTLARHTQASLLPPLLPPTLLLTTGISRL